MRDAEQRTLRGNLRACSCGCFEAHAGSPGKEALSAAAASPRYCIPGDCFTCPGRITGFDMLIPRFQLLAAGDYDVVRYQSHARNLQLGPFLLAVAGGHDSSSDEG